MKVKRIIVHPANMVYSAASFTHDVEAMQESEPRRFVKQLREFFKSFETVNFNHISAVQVQKLVDAHGLSVSLLETETTKKLKNLK